MDTETMLSADAFLQWCFVFFVVMIILCGVYSLPLFVILHIIAAMPDNNWRSRLNKMTNSITGILVCLTMIPLGVVIYGGYFAAIPPPTVSIMIILIGIAFGAWVGMGLYHAVLVTIERVELRKQETQDREKVQ